MEIIGVLGRTLFYQVVIVGIAFIPRDNVQIGLGQVNVIQLAGLIQLEGHICGLHHLNGDGIEAGVLLSAPPGGVRLKDLLVALDVLGQQIGAAIPHGSVVHAQESIHTQLLNQGGGSGIQADVGRNGVKIGLLADAGIDHSVIVRGFNAHHAQEGLIVGSEGLGLGFVQACGVVIIILGAHDHLIWHGGVGGSVLGGVQHPLQTGNKIGGCQVSLLLTVDVNPLEALAQMEGPGNSVIVGFPALCQTGHQLALGVRAEQAVDQVGGDIEVGGHLAVQDVQGLNLTVGGFIGNQVGDCLCIGLHRLIGFRRFRGARAGLCWTALLHVAATAAAGCQRQRHGQS